jgi:18S rRNA (guanine1575-N7)-methyltransferase
LDCGCGSGLSGEVISLMGHMWVGLDISKSMLEIAWSRESPGDLILGDMG